MVRVFLTAFENDFDNLKNICSRLFHQDLYGSLSRALSEACGCGRVDVGRRPLDVSVWIDGSICRLDLQRRRAPNLAAVEREKCETMPQEGLCGDCIQSALVTGGRGVGL